MATTDKAQTLIDKTATIITELAAELESGKSDTLVRYLDSMSQFHNYSFGNVLLMVCQRKNVTMVAGFKQWQKKFDRSVMKGEHGMKILAPMICKEKDDAGNETTRCYGFRTVAVFDVSQTDGKELPKFAKATGDPGENMTKVHDVAKSYGITITMVDDLRGANGASYGNGRVEVVNGRSDASTFKTMVHEVAHERLHWEDKDKNTKRNTAELEAEAVAYVVSKHIGLDTGTASADYIQLYNGDAKALADSMDRIQKTASGIIKGLES